MSYGMYTAGGFVVEFYIERDFAVEIDNENDFVIGFAYER